jgi:hypothetical protein
VYDLNLKAIGSHFLRKKCYVYMTIKGKPTYFFTHDKGINSKKKLGLWKTEWENGVLMSNVTWLYVETDF